MSRTNQTRRQFLNTALQSSFVLGSAFLSPHIGSGVARAQAPAKGRSEPITVRFWHQEPDPRSIKALEEIAADFHKLHPDIIVKPQAMGWLDLELKVITALAAGNPPEIADTFVHHAGWAAGKNMLRPMDDVVNAIGKEVWYHELLDWLHWDDHYWAVPMTWGTDMFLYRKDLAQEKGLAQFKTWDDWLKYAQATNDAPKRYGCTLAGNASLWFNEDVYEFVGSNGGHLWDDEGNPTFTNDAVYGTLEFYKQLQAYMPQGWLSHGYVETLNNWATEKAACLRGWGRTIGYIRQYAQKDKQNPDVFAATTMPIGPHGDKGWTQSNDDVFVIYKQSKYPDAAAEFVKFYYAKDNHRKFCLTVPLHLLPVTRAVAEDAEYQNDPTIKQWKVWDEPQWTALKNRWIAPLFMTKLSHRKLPHLTEIAHAGIMGEMVVDVVSKGLTPKDAAAKAEAKTAQLLKELDTKKG
jgi:ABC-type glycerol-3-phosphate transport system substrate-binding protein